MWAVIGTCHYPPMDSSAQTYSTLLDVFHTRDEAAVLAQKKRIESPSGVYTYSVVSWSETNDLNDID